MILDFNDADGDKHFEYLYEGFIIGGSLIPTKGISVLRKELALMEKFESISHEYPCGKKIIGDEVKRKINKEGNLQIHIDAGEFDLLYNYVTSVPWSTGKSVRYAMETINWLERSQKMSV